MNSFNILAIFTSISFLYFGLSCLFTAYMKREFLRYGLSKYRKTVGVLQLMGSFGLALGLWPIDWLTVLASTGLFVLMSLGVVARLRIKDPWYNCLPALFYALLSAYLAFGSL